MPTCQVARGKAEVQVGMDRDERADFRNYCKTVTLEQLQEVVRREQEAAEGGDQYRMACAAIAESVLEAREGG